ncbi:hypothetical protein CDL15_Pgr001650 [Punica granatum]|uniref:CNNM transmembrane domain-containing protein n=1 Tax=Punica granatum TaxID=22663 RepID=A0A218XBJ0_PUNGR|nr:hypothetical protein CDL15_Pgr001650 [Punica granatum]
MGIEYRCCGTGFFIHIGIIVFLVGFAGLMSGLTLGLMSMSLVDLEVLAKSGTPSDRKHAEKMLPVVKRQHLLLCTLLICNAAAMEALPIFLDSLVTAWVAILISVTLILLFGEIIPQAVCSRHGLAVGAAVAPLVRILVCICFPIAYPISKLLDFLLGAGHEALFRRAELKTLVDLHGDEAGKGGELTRDETTIIAGALELSDKTAGDAMTPISEIFSIDVKNLLTIHPEDEVPVKNVTIRKIPRVSDRMPLYDILNEFQKGHSHMAVVVKELKEQEQGAGDRQHEVRDVRLDIHGEENCHGNCLKRKQPLKKLQSDANKKLQKRSSKSMRWAKDMPSEVLHLDEDQHLKLTEGNEAIGIITLEDVIEELLQEEIFDETDHRNEHL